MENKASEQITYEKLFRAIGDEHRLHILRLLAEREMNAQELLAAENIVQSTLSHHMKTLQEGGLVSVRREGKWAYYTLNTEALERAEEYLGSIRKDAAVPAENAKGKKEEKLSDAGKAAGGAADEDAREEERQGKKVSLYPRLNDDGGRSAGKDRGRQKKKAEKGTKIKEAKAIETKGKETGEKQDKDKTKDRKKDKKKKHGKK